MTNWQDKYPIGSQWKTRGGWRAVVVDHNTDDPDHDMNGDTFDAYHTKEDRWGERIIAHWPNGKSGGPPEDFDLIEPWIEPRAGEFWVNVYPDGGLPCPAQTRGEADKQAADIRIACVHVKWTEGEGLEGGE